MNARMHVQNTSATQETPASFLQYRHNQLRLTLELAGVDISDLSILEIGGGVSGQAADLAKQAKEVVVTDLMEPDTVHAERFSDVASRIRDPRVKAVCCRAESLPLKDDSIDLVYSSFVLEHVNDRARALTEMKRVLRPDGIVIAIVPNTAEPILRTALHLTVFIPKQLLKIVLYWSGIAAGRAWTSSLPSRPKTLRAGLHMVRAALKPPIHGEYESLSREIKGSSPKRWDALFEQAGFGIRRRFTISIEGYLYFSTRLITWLQSKLLHRVERWGKSRWAVRVGTSYGIVATPNPE